MGDEIKLTKEQNLMAVRAYLEGVDYEIDGYIIETSEEYLINFIDTLIAADVKHREKNRETNAKKRQADVITDVVFNALEEDYLIIDDIVAKITDPAITKSKIVYRLKKLVEDGKAEKVERVGNIKKVGYRRKDQVNTD